ncbi:MAG TPA: hypothetical protein PLW44_09955 [Chitinophagales bacterium]|nr:hypothetical protein [Chitinophagales bacterium]
MKKVLFSVVMLAMLAGSVSSCKKACSSCTISGSKTEYCKDDFTQTQIDAAKLGCQAAGGTWE